MAKVFRLVALAMVNSVLVGTRFFRTKAWLLRATGHTIGTGTKIVGPLQMSPSFLISIGNDCWVGRNLTVHGNGAVLIGDRCDISPDVTVLTGTHDLGGHDRRAGTGRSTTISVGNGCWIGARSTLLGDLSVSDSSIVSAGSLVIRDVAPNTLVGGTPAVALKTLP